MRKMVCIITVVFSLCSAGLALARASKGVIRELYECGFPVNETDVKIDGQIREKIWAFAPWHKVTHDMAPPNRPAGPDDEDASYEFACAANSEFLYIAFKVSDDEIVINEDAKSHKDDSVELYIDGDNVKGQSYDDNDIQIRLGADGESIQGSDKGVKVADVAIEFAVTETAYGWAVEASVPLKPFGIKVADGLVIGFNTHLNDDDDGGDRDHKLSWGVADVDDQSYQNPSRFGEMRFVGGGIAVSPADRLAILWGSIKK